MGGRVVIVLLCLAALAFAAASPAAAAEPGELDARFGTNGRITALTDGGFVARAVSVTPDSKIVVAGYSCAPTGGEDGTCRMSGGSSFRMVRYTAAGDLDRSFGAGGAVTTAVGTGRSQAFDALVLPDGRIMLGGVARDGGGRDGFAVVCYLATGAVDRSYGEQGISIVPIGEGFAGIADLTAAPGGGMFATGVARAGGEDRIAIARYQPNGVLDGTFGSGGAVLGGPGRHAAGLAAAVTPAGELLTAGIAGASSAPGDARLGLWLVTAGGVTDTRFGNGGGLLVGLGASTSFANAVTDLRDGRTIAAGSALDDQGRQVMAFVRLTPDGRLDATWDGDGISLVQVGLGALAADVARDAQGRLIAFGQAAAGGRDWRFALVRLNPDGLLDEHFGTGGVEIHGFPGASSARATAGAVAPDGGLIAAGVACRGGQGAQCAGGSPHLALARYVGGGPLAGAGQGLRASPFVAMSFPTRPVRLRPAAVRVRVTCLQPETCRARMAVRTRNAVRLPGAKRRRRVFTLAAGSVSVAAGATREVRLRLGRTARRLVRRPGRLRIRVTARGRGADGAARSASRSTTLTAR